MGIVLVLFFSIFLIEIGCGFALDRFALDSFTIFIPCQTSRFPQMNRIPRFVGSGTAASVKSCVGGLRGDGSVHTPTKTLWFAAHEQYGSNGQSI